MDPYQQTTDFSIAKGCPWYEAQQTYGPPNIDWCEPSRCSVFDEPANTWSNLAFLFAFIYLIKKFEDRFIRFYAVTLLVVGFFSFVYHATNNAFSQFFDFVGMYLMTSIILAFNAKRLGGEKANIYAYFWFFTCLNLILFMSLQYMEIAIQWSIALNVLGIFMLEATNGFREKSFHQYGTFVIGFIFLACAQTSAMIDLKRIYCNPNNLWIHGHVFWHLFNGVALTFMGVHMNRIKKHQNIR